MPTIPDTHAKAELTIQEMAKQSGLSEHTLRYYERIGLLTPIPRDGSSGHRRYSPETVSIVESLSCLRGTGMSIDDMRMTRNKLNHPLLRKRVMPEANWPFRLLG